MIKFEFALIKSSILRFCECLVSSIQYFPSIKFLISFWFTGKKIVLFYVLIRSTILKMKKLSISWETYTDHLREMLHDMRSSNELTDVTLVSEDMKQFKAHRVVLNACSPVFKSMKSDNYFSSTYIFMRGIQSHEMESILQFIYLGQATINKDRIKEFLRVARSLEVKELSKDIENFHDVGYQGLEQKMLAALL